MPETVSGFLLLAGTGLILLSLFAGPIEIKEVRIPSLPKLGRIIVGVLGGVFLLLSAYTYYVAWKTGKDIPMLHEVPVYNSENSSE